VGDPFSGLKGSTVICGRGLIRGGPGPKEICPKIGAELKKLEPRAMSRNAPVCGGKMSIAGEKEKYHYTLSKKQF